jgi:capsular polysaccharide biosynthesis protein
MDLTFAQTVKLFSEADAVCSPVGSNMSNIIFCKPGCVVLNIVPDLWMDSFVDWIAPLVHADYHYEVFPTGGPTAAQIIIDLQLLEKLHDSAPRLKTI